MIGREFASLLTRVITTLEEHEYMEYLVVVNDQWTVDNGHLTPTIKIKRSVIEEYHLSRANEWLQTKQKVI